MNILQLNDLGIKVGLTPHSYKGDCSKIYRLRNGRLAKIYNKDILSNPISSNILERKVLSAYQHVHEESLNVPEAAIYDRISFNGYVMQETIGKTYSDYFFSLSDDQISDINLLTNLFLSVDKVVKEKNKKNIFFPDMCTTENIIVKKDNRIEFIDYDGIQIDNIPVFLFSSSLGDEKQYYSPKYFDKNTLLFNSNLDKKSLVLLYFHTVLGCDLQKTVELFSLFKHQSADVTIENIFKELNLHDYDFGQKISNLYKDNVDNDYITEDVIRISQNHKMTSKKIVVHGETLFKKRLI